MIVVVLTLLLILLGVAVKAALALLGSLGQSTSDATRTKMALLRMLNRFKTVGLRLIHALKLRSKLTRCLSLSLGERLVLFGSCSSGCCVFIVSEVLIGNNLVQLLLNRLLDG